MSATGRTSKGHFATHLEVLLDELPELLALSVGRVFNLQVSTLGDNLLSSEGTLGVPPSGILPPSLDGVDLLPVLLVFLLEKCLAHIGGGLEDRIGMRIAVLESTTSEDS